MSDWKERLRETFSDADLRFEGGESSREATERDIASVEDTLEGGVLPAVVVTHGNLMALVLRHFDSRLGFEEWQNLANPDVFQTTMTAGTARITHLRLAP